MADSATLDLQEKSRGVNSALRPVVQQIGIFAGVPQLEKRRIVADPRRGTEQIVAGSCLGVWLLGTLDGAERTDGDTPGPPPLPTAVDVGGRCLQVKLAFDALRGTALGRSIGAVPGRCGTARLRAVRNRPSALMGYWFVSILIHTISPYRGQRRLGPLPRLTSRTPTPERHRGALAATGLCHTARTSRLTRANHVSIMVDLEQPAVTALPARRGRSAGGHTLRDHPDARYVCGGHPVAARSLNCRPA